MAESRLGGDVSPLAENISKDLAVHPPVTVATEGRDHTWASEVVTPETTPLSSETTTQSSEKAVQTSTAEDEECLSALLRAVEGGVDVDPEESSSDATAGGSSDSASFSIPSLELSDGTALTVTWDLLDGNTITGNLLDGNMVTGRDTGNLLEGDEALGAEGHASPTEVPSLGATHTPAGGAAASAGASAAGGDPSMPAYLVKWITWKDKKTPIVTQSENGPCPLLAIMNTLFLRWKAKLPAQTEVITTEDLMAHLGECVLSVTPREKADGMELNFQQNVSDAMAVLPKLCTGLDVNVRFTGVSDFEFTPELIAFDLLSIPLYHGWLTDPQSPEMVRVVGKLSYNQLVEKIIDYKHSAESSRVSEGLVAEQFLEATASQLSYHGLCELSVTAREGELSVFFRNNHFSTMIKHQGHLYLLVTDQGFLQEEGLVWESLHNVEGDGNFCDSDFRLCHPPQRSIPPPQRATPPPQRATPPAEGAPLQPHTAQEQKRQIDQDYLVAMSLQQVGGAPEPVSDLELARRLQQEEYQQQGPQQQVRGQAAGQSGGGRRREKDSDCVLL